MKFVKDLLLFELQATGQDPEKDSVLQLAGILLDKDNLLEKAHFNSYVRLSFLEGTMREHARMLNVELDILKHSPKGYEVIKQFHNKFGSESLLAMQNLTSYLFLRNAYKKAGVSFEFPKHILDLWTLGYVYTLNYGLKKIPTFATFLDYFNLTQERPFDALEKVRLEAEIFRKIIKAA